MTRQIGSKKEQLLEILTEFHNIVLQVVRSVNQTWNFNQANNNLCLDKHHKDIRKELTNHNNALKATSKTFFKNIRLASQ